MTKAERPSSAFVANTLENLRRRSRALRHKNAAPTIERFIEIKGEFPEERVEITISSRARQRLMLTIWNDRTVRVRASESIWQAGWKFQFAFEGRYGNGDGRELIEALEASLSAMFEMTKEDESKLTAIWSPILARGPKEL